MGVRVEKKRRLPAGTTTIPEKRHYLFPMISQYLNRVAHKLFLNLLIPQVLVDRCGETSRPRREILSAKPARVKLARAWTTWKVKVINKAATTRKSFIALCDRFYHGCTAVSPMAFFPWQHSGILMCISLSFASTHN